MLPAQQELEDAPFGCGVVLLHVRGNVAAVGTAGSLAGPSARRQPQAAQWGGPAQPTLEGPEPGSVYSGGGPGSPPCRVPGARGTAGPSSALGLQGPCHAWHAKVLAGCQFPQASSLRSLSH